MELNFHVTINLFIYLFSFIDQLIIDWYCAAGRRSPSKRANKYKQSSCSIVVEDWLFFGFSLVVVKAAAKQLTTTTTGAAHERAVLRAQRRPCFAVFCPDAVACTGGKFALSSQQQSRMSLTVNLPLELRCCNSMTFLR
jgi:hypothetical protein